MRELGPDPAELSCLEQPGRVLADVHRVLVAVADPRAETMARRAGGHLLERSAGIRDEELRARFLAAPVSIALAAIAASPGA